MAEVSPNVTVAQCLEWLSLLRVDSVPANQMMIDCVREHLLLGERYKESFAALAAYVDADGIDATGLTEQLLALKHRNEMVRHFLNEPALPQEVRKEMVRSISNAWASKMPSAHIMALMGLKFAEDVEDA